MVPIAWCDSSVHVFFFLAIIVQVGHDQRDMLKGIGQQQTSTSWPFMEANLKKT